LYRLIFASNCLAILLLFTPAQSNAAGVHLTLYAGKHALPASPVSIELPAALKHAAQLELRRLPSGEVTPVQIETREAKRYVVWLPQSALKAGETRRYTLSAVKKTTPGSKRDATAGPMQAVRKDGVLTVSMRGRPVLRYNARVRQPPAGVAAHYASSGHIHPVFAPSGEVVTAEFPADHLHQHALFGAWVRTKFKGRKIDFWNQAGKTGRVDHLRFRGLSTGGDVYCEFTAVRQHKAIDVSPPELALTEVWRVRAYNTPDYHLFDIESRQTAGAEAGMLHIEKYHYGGMALRGRDAWVSDSVRLLTDSGHNRLQGNAKPATWVAMHGKLNDGAGGIAMLSHADNFRAPQTVRLHPRMPYFCFMPAATAPFAIEPGRPLVSRYRYCVFNGDIDPALLNALATCFAQPPRVDVKPLPAKDQ